MSVLVMCRLHSHITILVDCLESIQPSMLITGVLLRNNDGDYIRIWQLTSLYQDWEAPSNWFQSAFCIDPVWHCTIDYQMRISPVTLTDFQGALSTGMCRRGSHLGCLCKCSNRAQKEHSSVQSSDKKHPIFNKRLWLVNLGKVCRKSVWMGQGPTHIPQ